MSTTETATSAGAKITQGFDDISALFRGNVDDPHEIYREHLLNDPVIKGDIVARFGAASFAGTDANRQIFTLFKHKDVLNILRDTKNYTSGMLMENGLGPFLDGLMITGLDGEPHRKLRGLLAPCFTPAVMDEWRNEVMVPLLEKEFVLPLKERGQAELVREMGVMFPIRVVYAVLGFPDDRDAVEEFAVHALKILGGTSPDPAAKAAAFQGFKDLYEPTLRAVQARRAEGATGKDLISRLMRSEFEGQSLDDHQITNFVRMMLPAASETTSRTFATLVTLLLKHPETLARVREDRTLMRKALDESMRLEPVATFKVREAEVDATFQGVDIPKGSIVSLCVAAANRDGTVFENPDKFDIDRKQMPAFGFGFGAHMCVGMWLAKAEIEAAIDLMLDNYPNLRFDPAYPEPEIVGVMLRGADAVHVVWDKA